MIIEVAGRDPHHEAQVAWLLNTSRTVYPFEGQTRVYLSPLFRSGRVARGSVLFRAVTAIRPELRSEIASLEPETVYLTHVKTSRKHGAKSRQAYFDAGAGRRSTSMPYSKEKPAKLTVRVDPTTWDSLAGWEMHHARKVFPRSDRPAQISYQVFLDPPVDNNGLVDASAADSITATLTSWEQLWREVVPSSAEKVVLQGGVLHPTSSSDWLNLTFEGEPYSTSIRKSSTAKDIPLQLEFLGQDLLRRPQVMRRMDTGEVVYPASQHRRIRVGTLLYKAAYEFGEDAIRAALKQAGESVAFEHIPVIQLGQRAAFRDPLRGVYRRLSVPFRPGFTVNATAHPLKSSASANGDPREWILSEAHDEKNGRLVFVHRDQIRHARAIALHKTGQIASTEEQVEAVQRLYRWGYFNKPNGLTTDHLVDLLFDYHGEVFGTTATNGMFELTVAASTRFPKEPGRFWETVYLSLKEAEHIKPARAADRHLLDVASQLAAGLEETSQDRQWKSTHAKIIKALRSHPGGRLMATDLAKLTGLGRVALYTHDYRSLVAAENKRRAGMKRPKLAIELREYQEHTEDPEQAIVKALRSHPGGRMTVKELAKRADVGELTLYNYNYRSLVEAENKRRAGMRRPRPAIILLRPGRPPSAAGLEEETRREFVQKLVGAAVQANSWVRVLGTLAGSVTVALPAESPAPPTVAWPPQVSRKDSVRTVTGSLLGYAHMPEIIRSEAESLKAQMVPESQLALAHYVQSVINSRRQSGEVAMAHHRAADLFRHLEQGSGDSEWLRSVFQQIRGTGEIRLAPDRGFWIDELLRAPLREMTDEELTQALTASTQSFLLELRQSMAFAVDVYSTVRRQFHQNSSPTPQRDREPIQAKLETQPDAPAPKPADSESETRSPSEIPDRPAVVEELVVDEMVPLSIPVELAAQERLWVHLENGTFGNLSNVTWRVIPSEVEEAVSRLADFKEQDGIQRFIFLDAGTAQIQQIEARLPVGHAPVFQIDEETATYLSPAVIAALMSFRELAPDLLGPDGVRPDYELTLRRSKAGDLLLTLA
ncbi:MAG: hypothetical protein Q7J69_02635 [Candidatus Omnitrophota bacterium]|nr:hypothetical protein [Candidatus Omnitrophota bacterium]